MTTKQESTRKFKMEQVMALWKKTGKSGNAYFSGNKLVGFYQTNKENPKSPDLIIYEVAEDGNVKKPSILSLWCQVSKDGKRQYLTGKFDGKKVVGFINKEANEENKKPYLSIYYSEPIDKKEEKESKVDLKNNDLPF